MSRALELYKDIAERGEYAIDELIALRTSEETYLDFKRMATVAGDRALAEDDRNNLAKAISGFGNTDGGIIVWGVDCRSKKDGADVAGKKCPTADAAHLRSLIENAISGLTVPSHGLVVSRVIARDDGSGFVVTHIPPSNNVPIQSLRDFKYYMRAGSNFLPMIHALLAGLFGRRPAPKLSVDFQRKDCARSGDNGELLLLAEISVLNDGPTIAEDIFVTVKDQCAGNTTVRVSSRKDTRFEDVFSGNTMHSILSKSGARLPPGMSAKVLALSVVIPASPTGDLSILITAGCAGAAPAHFELQSSHSRLEHAVKLFHHSSDFEYVADRAFGLTDD